MSSGSFSAANVSRNVSAANSARLAASDDTAGRIVISRSLRPLSAATSAQGTAVQQPALRLSQRLSMPEMQSATWVQEQHFGLFVLLTARLTKARTSLPVSRLSRIVSALARFLPPAEPRVATGTPRCRSRLVPVEHPHISVLVLTALQLRRPARSSSKRREAGGDALRASCQDDVAVAPIPSRESSGELRTRGLSQPRHARSKLRTTASTRGAACRDANVNVLRRIAWCGTA
jgi:hypothetical protein